MVKNYSKSLLFICTILLSCIHLSLNAQAYRKGSLLISLSEGSTFADYSTNDVSGKKPTRVNSQFMCGDRDPFIIEYGLTNKWGIGLSSGTDIFKVNSATFYNVSTADNTMKVSTSELTFDVNYHVFVNKRLDLSVFVSTGLFSANSKSTAGDVSYNYSSGGTILRAGTKARYYFWKRLGAFGMISSYSASGSPKNVKDNTVGKNYATSVTGMAVEAGFCFRILK